MAWNESGNGKDPWKRDGDEPNDLDQIVQNWQRRLGSILGGGGGARSGGGGGGYVLIILMLIAWGATGFYRVDEAERGVVQRFGAYTVTTMPGLHWHIPFPIESVDLVNINEVSNYAYRNEMLTADEQYVFIDMVVQYRRTDPVKFSFNVVEPELTLRDVTESALREVVGTSELEVLIAARRDEIASRSRDVLQITLDSYGPADNPGAGLEVTSISLETVNYPQAVQAAVDDAQKARNDSERYVLEADAYANDIVPRARGDAAKILEDAQAYRDRVIADAQGEAGRFEALLTEYQKAPRVTRERLYIDAIEDVYGRSNKVFLDAEGSGNLLYLPIDQMLNQGSRPSSSDGTRASDSRMPTQSQGDISAEPVDTRERRTRQ
jgi:membrane protease subunit HflK